MEYESSLHVDISSAISTIFQCQVIQIKEDLTSTIIKGMSNTDTESPLYYAIRSDPTIQIFAVSFEYENYENSISSHPPVTELKYDGIGRLHLMTPHAGPSYIRLRSHKYNSTTVSTNITDLFNILHDISKIKSIFMFLADGGPAFNPAHTINQLFYFRLFKKLEADILCVRHSAFNSIEHLWSPCADRLSGVVFSPIADGDESAPALQTKLSSDVSVDKEKRIFYRAIETRRDKHRYDMTCNNRLVDVNVVPCNEEQLLFDDYDRVKACLKSPPGCPATWKTWKT